MWLVQLYKADENDDKIVDVYSTNYCSTDYINPENYEHELNLCRNWGDNENKTLLILKKRHGAVLEIPRNERILSYWSYISYHTHTYYADFIIFEYLTESGPLIDFYVNTNLICWFPLDLDKISGFSSVAEGILAYIKNKTLNITILGAADPKYSIKFDDDCSYYLLGNNGLVVIKKPFLIRLYHGFFHYIYIHIYITPKLISEINNDSIIVSEYNPATDQVLNLDKIISQYFDIKTMSGILHENQNIDDDSNIFGYNLIRALTNPIRHDLINLYDFTINDTRLNSSYYGSLHSSGSLLEVPLYTYFPLFRTKLNEEGTSYPYPQYDPLDEDSYISYLYTAISLLNSSSINYFGLTASYFIYGSYGWCSIYSPSELPSWTSETCNFKVPFRFVGAADCSDPTTDNWATNPVNANYLFKIAKSPSSDIYSIKGVGCNDITQPLSFNADYALITHISATFFETLRKVTSFGFGYDFIGIQVALSNYVASTADSGFVLFSENLIDDVNDFVNIYEAVRTSLPNFITCYFGDDSKIPHDLNNKVLHSNAIVTDLDTNEQMPLVIKYIRYAQRLYKMFNG